MRTYRFNKAFYKEKSEVKVTLDDNWVWVATHPQDMHYEGQVDYSTVIPKSKYDKLVESEKFDFRYIHECQLGDYVLLSIDAVDKNDELNTVSLDEFNKHINWNDIYIAAYHKDDWHLICVSQLVGLKNAKFIYANTLNYKSVFEKDRKVNILEFGEPINIDYLNTSSVRYGITFCKSDEKTKKLYYTLLSRDLKTIGVDFRNEFVDDSLDTDEEEKKAVELVKEYEDIVTNIKRVIDIEKPDKVKESLKNFRENVSESEIQEAYKKLEETCKTKVSAREYIDKL